MANASTIPPPEPPKNFPRFLVEWLESIRDELFADQLDKPEIKWDAATIEEKRP